MKLPSPLGRKLPSAAVTTLVALLLALQWWLGVSATQEIGSTTDELAHVAGGLSYWRFNDYRLQPENGNLPQRVAALPWLIAGARMEPADAKSWGNSNVWIIGYRLFYGSGNNTGYLLFLSRATMGLFGVGLGGLIFAWSRRLWGDAGGLVSLGLYTFCPNFLANAPLATSDTAMALGLLASCGAFWGQLQRLDWKSGGLSVAVVALTCVTKFSFTLLLPVFALMVLIRLASDAPLTVRLGTVRLVQGWRGKLGVFVGSAIVHAAVAWIVIWACFGFRFSATAPGMPVQAHFFWSWDIVMPPSGFWHLFFHAMRSWHFLPDSFLAGFATVLYAGAERGAFLNGDYSNVGWPQFFPYAFLVKTPWSQLMAFFLALAMAVAVWFHLSPRSLIWKRLRCDLYRVTPLLLLFAVYWLFSITSHLNIGLRHILPTYPILFIGAGLLARQAAGRWLATTAAALVLLNAVESTQIRPHYLAYFNGFAGGPANGWRHLVDSSLDWGQDLPGLAAWLRREQHPGEEVYVSYAGSGDPAYEGIRDHELAWGYNFDRPRPWFELGPGIYCIGASMLQNVYSGWRGPWTLEKERNLLAFRAVLDSAPAPKTEQEWKTHSQQRDALDQLRFVRLCSYLRLRLPDANVGYSIFIYRLTADEVHAAVYGSMSELASAMERTLEARDR